MDDEPKSLVDKIKAKFSNKNKSPAKDNKNSSVQAQARKRIVIYGSIAVIVTVVLWDEIFPPESNESVPQEAIKLNKRYKVNKAQVPKTDNVENKASEVPAGEAPLNDVVPAQTATEATSTLPTEEASKSVSVDAANLETQNTTSQGANETAAVEESKSVTEEEVKAALENQTTESQVQPDTEATNTQEGVAVEKSEDSIDGQENKTASDDDMTEKILQDLENQAKNQTKAKVQITEYVSPPDYEYKGRGLVYNCVGKHWACIDAPSYKVCQNNFDGNKYLKKKTECNPVNVYQSQKGCETIQNRMVSSSAKTNFCQN